MSSSRPLKALVASLPTELPLFPLTGAVLLPQARLPLNIFEPRYLSMVEDALGKGRLIGMIQPTTGEDSGTPPLYSVGCAGRITSFSETDDGRFLIVLTGVCRFRVAAEQPTGKMYRSVKPDWTPYLTDLGDNEVPAIDRHRLIDLLHIYFKKNAISVDWSVVENAPDDVLISTIIMICPLAPNEKQALLEAEEFLGRAKMLETLLEMAVMPQPETEADVKH
jgi:Lon protease-like protein